VPAAVADQVKRDTALASRLRMPWQQIIVLERFARAAGAARWYFARSALEFDRVIEELRGGSCVSFYFDEQLRVDFDNEAARQAMFDEVSPAREILLGYPIEGQVHVQIELVTGPTELTEALMHRVEGGVVFWGPWPSREGGPGTVTIDLVDEDGILRPHPH
jgi:hypothetical protein